MFNIHLVFLVIVLQTYIQSSKCNEIQQPLKTHLLRTWVSNSVNLFYPECAPPRHQVTIVALANLNSTKLELTALPKDRNGIPVIKNSQSFSPDDKNDYVNYVVTNPEPVSANEEPVLAKQLIVDELPKLWNNYVNHYGEPPTMLLLYSSIMLSQDMVTIVIDQLALDQYSNITKIISFSKDGTEIANRNCSVNENSIKRMTNAGIFVFHQSCWGFPTCTSERIRWRITKLRKSKSSIDQCTVADTLQGCVFQCLGDSFMCCSNEGYISQMKANFINELYAECGSRSLHNCMTTRIRAVLGNDCNCLSVSEFTKKFAKCSRQCSRFAMSNPLDSADPTSFTGLLQDTNDLQSFEKAKEQCEETDMYGIFCSKKKVQMTVKPAKKVCTDVRKTGDNCFQRKSNYVNAKDYLCRQHHPCGYHGYSYSWCYTDSRNNWEYCCTGSCGYHGYSYRWCKAGSTWEYCET